MNYMNTMLPLLAAEQEQQEPYRIFYETKANLKREHIEQLTSAGVRWIQPGIENMHDGVLKLINKGTTAWVNTQLLKREVSSFTNKVHFTLQKYRSALIRNTSRSK